MTLVLASDHGCEGGMVVGELRVAMCSRRSDFAKGKHFPFWATTTTSLNAVPFLKVFVRLLSIPLMLGVKTQDPQIGRWRRSY
jgi:hypothetical protein